MKWDLIPIPTDDPQGYRDAVRLNSLGSLFFFTNFVLKKNRLAALHWYICSRLESDDLHLVLELPMSAFKSTCGAEALSMWWALPFTNRDEDLMGRLGCDADALAAMRRVHQQNARTLVTHETGARVVSMGKAIDGHYLHNDIFRFVFEDIIPTNDTQWNNHSKMQRRDPNSRQDLTTATYEFRSVGQALQGIHVDGIINDDSVGRAAQENMLRGDGSIMGDTYRWWKQTTTRFDPIAFTRSGLGRQLVIGNRWGHADLNSKIRENHPEFVVESHSAEGGCCEIHPPETPIFPEEWSMERLHKQRETLTLEGNRYDYCFPPDAPVLMADWSEKRIDRIVPGDVVVGFQAGERDGWRRERRYHLTKTKVVAINTRWDWVVRARLASGREVRCTRDHRWFLADSLRNRKPYRRMEIGKQLVSVYTPYPVKTPEEQRDLDWLGGLMDGEGCCNPSSLNIAQSGTKNPEVCAEIEAVCGRLGIPTHRNHVVTPQGRNGYSWNLHGGRTLLVRMIQNAKMAKRTRFIERLWARPGRVCEVDGKDRVVSIALEKEMLVHNIETETGNYVAYGYATKNCHFYLNKTMLPEDCLFKPNWIQKYVCAESAPELGPDDIRNFLLLRHRVTDGDPVPDLNAGVLHKRLIVVLADPKHRRPNHVVLVAGYEPERDWIYLLKLEVGKFMYGDLLDVIYKLAGQMRLEEFYTSKQTAEALKFYIDERNRRDKLRALRVFELQCDDSDAAQTLRIESLQSLFRGKQFWCHPSFKEFFAEYESFPGGPVEVLNAVGMVPSTLEGIRRKDLSDWYMAQHQAFSSRGTGAGGY